MSKTPCSGKDSAEGHHFAPGSPKTEETPSCEDCSFSPTASNRDEHSCRADTASSADSLDRNLYGDYDSFSKNLEYLKSKLRQLSLRGFSDNSEENFSGEETEEMQPTHDGSAGCLPVRETFIDLADPSTVMYRSFEVYSIPTTIYEVSEVVSSGSEEYSVPMKKHCCWGETPALVPECTSTTSRSNLSRDSGINYVVPTKRRCIMDTPRVGCSAAENWKRDVWTQCGDVKSPERRRKSAQFSSVSELTPRTDQSELRLNIPSSTMSERTASERTEPRIQTIDTTTRKQSKFRTRSNKIAPFETDSSTERMYSAGDQNKDYLYKRYYEDTSEISCEYSTPGAAVSSYGPDIPSSRDGQEEQSSRGFTTRSSLSSSGFVKSMSRGFDPVFSSSLDVPKRWIHNYEFPAFTKFAVYPLSVDMEKHGNSPAECYRSKASTLLSSPTLSPASRKKSHRPSKNTCEVKQKSSQRICRKKQSTDMSFYAVSDTNLGTDRGTKWSESGGSRPSTAIAEDHTCTNCFCFNVFFSRKKKKRFFT